MTSIVAGSSTRTQRPILSSPPTHTALLKLNVCRFDFAVCLELIGFCGHNEDIRCLFKRFTFARNCKKFAACPVVKINIIKFSKKTNHSSSETKGSGKPSRRQQPTHLAELAELADLVAKALSFS